MKLDDLLDGAAAKGARSLCLALLDAAQEAHAAFAAQPDADTLHDLRVALRRLRTTLRAFAPLLAQSVGRKSLRRLGKLARTTAAAREADVQLVWLQALREHTPPGQLAALDWLVQHLEARRAACQAQLDAGLARRFQRAQSRLRARLEPHRAVAAETSLAQGLAGLLRAQGQALQDAMAALQGARDIEAAHVARIEAKRLRYLLEPLREGKRADATALVAELRELQDVLGEVHDAAVLCDDLGAALPKAAAAEARRWHAALAADPSGVALKAARKQDLVAGLLKIDAAAHVRLHAAFSPVETAWPAPRVAHLVADVNALAQALVAVREGGKRA